MEELTLVIMAAGMGSRFGGIKQIEPVGPNGEIISEYNIYDAIKCGFKKIVFIIRKEHLDIFRNKIIKNYKDKIKVEFAFQEFDTFEFMGNVPNERVKMLGTVHAILCAKDKINGPFVVINADDYYGFSSFQKVSTFFKDNNTDSITVNYPFISVSSSNGAVKRGVCEVENGKVSGIVESEISIINDKCIAKSIEREEEFEIEKNTGVSMNFFGLRKEILDDMEVYFNEYAKNIDLKNECLLPEFLNKEIKNGKLCLYEELSTSKWMGMTYKEDLNVVKKEILEKIKNGEYPENLWGKKWKIKNLFKTK